MPLFPRFLAGLLLGTAFFCWSLPSWGNAWSNYDHGICRAVGLAAQYQKYPGFTSAQANTYVTLYRRANMAGNGYTMYDQDTLLLEDQFGKRYYSAYQVIDPSFVGRCDEPLALIEQTLTEVLKTPLGLSLLREVLNCSTERIQRHFGVRMGPAQSLSSLCRSSSANHPWVKPSDPEQIEQSLAQAIAELPWYYLLPKENWTLLIDLATRHGSAGLGSIETLFSKQVDGERKHLQSLLAKPRQYTFFVSKDNPSPIDSFTDGVGHQTYLVIPIQPKKEHGRINPDWAQPLLDPRFDFTSELESLKRIILTTMAHETLAVFFDSKTNFFQNPGVAFTIFGAGGHDESTLRARQLLAHPLLQDAFVAMRAFQVEQEVFAASSLIPDYRGPVPSLAQMDENSCVQSVRHLANTLSPISLPLAMRNIPRLLGSSPTGNLPEVLAIANNINRFNLRFAVKYGRSLGLDLLAAMDLSRFKLNDIDALKPIIQVTEDQWDLLKSLRISIDGQPDQSLCTYMATPRLSGFNLAFQSGPRPRIKGDGNFDPIKKIKKTRPWQLQEFQGGDK